MSKDVFQEYQEELESKFTPEKEEEIKLEVGGSVGGLRFIADIFELFLTKFISVLVGKGADHSNKK